MINEFYGSNFKGNMEKELTYLLWTVRRTDLLGSDKLFGSKDSFSIDKLSLRVLRNRSLLTSLLISNYELLQIQQQPIFTISIHYAPSI